MAFTTLVSTEILARHLEDPSWIVFDCRHDLADPQAGRREYAASHIPGAQHLHLDADLSGPMTGKNGRHPLPDPDVFIARMEQAGVHSDTQVVAYDSGPGHFAARLWWLLRWTGHEKVAVLDGGFAKWMREQRPVTCAPLGRGAVPAGEARRWRPGLGAAKRPGREGAPAAAFTAQDGSPGGSAPEDSAGALRACVQVAAARFSRAPGRGWVDADEVASYLGSPAWRLIDARSPERFQGIGETLDPVGGHIPGAVNRYYMENLEQDGCFKPAPTLRREFLALIGAVPPERVVHQCGSGVTACHNLLAMEIAGLSGSRLYPGSWSEWCADPHRPMEKPTVSSPEKTGKKKARPGPRQSGGSGLKASRPASR